LEKRIKFIVRTRIRNRTPRFNPKQNPISYKSKAYILDTFFGGSSKNVWKVIDLLIPRCFFPSKIPNKDASKRINIVDMGN
jgi:hypothetical protein